MSRKSVRRTEIYNSVTHMIGAVGALAGIVILLVYAGLEGSAAKVISFSVYGLTLFTLYLVSTLYHGLQGRVKQLFKMLDHQAIYLLIAGTYTPFTLITLQGATGWWIFGIIWSLAVAGTVLDALPQKGARIVPVIIYIAMGWLILFALDALLAELPTAGFYWLLTGGLLYTFGVVFFVLSHWYPWTHVIWHLFVLGGSACHYFAILLYT